MASQSRHERQLMRQRGAGRDVGRTDFGLDFGGAFLAPVRSSRSRSGTPANRRTSARRASRTSIRANREPSQPRTQRSASASIRDHLPVVKASDQGVLGDADQDRQSKRRRTTVYDQSLQPLVEHDVPEIDPESSGPSRTMSTSNLVQDEGSSINVHANEGYRDAKKTSRRRKRKSIGQQSLRRKKRPSEAATALETPNTTDEVTDADAEDAEEDGRDQDAELQQPADRELDDAQPDSPAYERTTTNNTLASIKSAAPARKKRKKRRSIGQQAGKRKSTATTARRRTGENLNISPSVDRGEVWESEPRSKTKPGSRSRGRSNVRPTSNRPSPHQPMERDNTSEDEDYRDEAESLEPPTPAPPGKKAQGRKSGTATSKPSSSQGSRASFPIITHRLAHFNALPTIKEVGESDPDSEEEQAREAEKRAVMDRPNPNAVDVLGQYCRETVQTAIERLEMGPASTRGTRKRRQIALEAVGYELEDRLFDMSAAVENRITLEGRTRKAKRSKAELQTRWLEVRKQREEIALRCDEIRQQNWHREKDREQKWAISEAAHKLTLEVQRVDPVEDQQEGLEYLLRTVADHVSDTSGKGGLLNRIKSFNRTLERMAGVLEGRDA